MLSGPKPESVITVNRRQYVILSEAGRGGSSKVFKVLNQDMEVLAIKRVKVPASSHFRTTLGSYANEIALLKQLRGSPSIIQLLDAEVQYECGTIKMVMEYGDTDLAKILLRKKSRSIDDHFTRGHWLQMLKAVHTIHEAKIIHGDLKPANFLVVRGELKLIDFGIAKAITSDDTTKVFREAQVGTPNYMSPEALDGSDSETDLHSARYRVGRASDIWSLGCILYQMLCGRAPFAHIKNTLQKLNCIQDPKYEISYRHVTDPVALQVLHGCLQRDPQNRMSIPDLMEHPFVCLSHDRNVRRANGSMKSASISEEDLLAVTMDFLDIVKREAVPRCSLLSTVIDDSDLAHGSNIVKALIPCLLKRLGKLSSSATPAPTVTGKSNYQNQSWKGGATPTTSVVTPSGAHTVLRGAGMAQNIR
ncbi:Serine/threonine protein kinase [Chondrus crispus]|uniref:Serine/threonine protein kinase n=1 Tax=Chondrus crispus TaxID=2769 RepID=S0F2S9_CHOCR|nr:Serine/threonine protein kinase [Chondrus crispus]CDF77421.1 Serine/threonine protein kinase [Chondrus crispus]|eukprot:XP_005712295.1 Serine/threonine protein kinase [Chondrus crispus]